MTIAEDLATQFTHRFGAVPRVFRAPGRVNIIGEHTDYNEGFVLPAALEQATYIAVAPRDDRRLRVRSLAYDVTMEVDLDDPDLGPREDWSDYVVGVAVELERAGHHLVGADLMIDGDLPIGAGLSSSAALEVALGRALLGVAGLAVEPVVLAHYCQRAENGFVGMRCGIMDQLISCCAVASHALLIDCRHLEMRPIPIDPSVRLMVSDTMVHHEHARGTYNLRRQECERGVALLSTVLGSIAALRDVTPHDLERHAGLLPEPILRRCRHVVSENARVSAAAAALDSGDLALCGRLMNESHESLRTDYEVSCPELDLMVELARGVRGVLGARMTGGGFGGCTVSLVEAEAVDRFTEIVGRAYQEATGKVSSIIACRPGPGAGPVVP